MEQYASWECDHLQTSPELFMAERNKSKFPNFDVDDDDNRENIVRYYFNKHGVWNEFMNYGILYLSVIKQQPHSDIHRSVSNCILFEYSHFLEYNTV
jgi:hypothetical protein